MKSFKIKSNIGEGLFKDEAVAVQLEFPDGSVGIFKLHALTQDRVIKLRKAGVSFKEHSDQEKAYNDAIKILDELVESGEYQGLEIDKTNRHKIASNLGLMSGIIQACGALAEEREEVEAKNSES